MSSQKYLITYNVIFSIMVLYFRTRVNQEISPIQWLMIYGFMLLSNKLIMTYCEKNKNNTSTFSQYKKTKKSIKKGYNNITIPKDEKTEDTVSENFQERIYNDGTSIHTERLDIKPPKYDLEKFSTFLYKDFPKTNHKSSFTLEKNYNPLFKK